METVVDSWPFLALRAGLDGCYVVFLVAGYLRPHSVRGTRNRYVWASVQRLAAWPAFGFVALSAVRAVNLDTGTMLLGVLLLPMAGATWWYLYARMRADDDDDVLRRAGRRARRTLRRLAASLQPSPVPHAG